VAQKRVAVQGVDAIEQALIKLRAEAGLEAHAGIGDPAALAPGRLRFSAGNS
jgi:hypothetical protein